MHVYLDYSQGHLEGSGAGARCVGVKRAEQDRLEKALRLDAGEAYRPCRGLWLLGDENQRVKAEVSCTWHFIALHSDTLDNKKSI